jgi:hypothetical protein
MFGFHEDRTPTHGYEANARGRDGGTGGAPEGIVDRLVLGSRR